MTALKYTHVWLFVATSPPFCEGWDVWKAIPLVPTCHLYAIPDGGVSSYVRQVYLAQTQMDQYKNSVLHLSGFFVAKMSPI